MPAGAPAAGRADSSESLVRAGFDPAAAGAAEAMAGVAEGLEVDEHAISRNLGDANIGTDIGESAAIVAALVSRRQG